MRGEPRPRARIARLCCSLALSVLIASCAWLAIPVAAAWHATHAILSPDRENLTLLVAPLEVQVGLQETLLLSAGLREAGIGGAGAPASNGARFLRAMAEDMIAAWGDPAVLAEVAEARAASSHWSGTLGEAIRRMRPTGLTSFEFELGPQGCGLTLLMELRDIAAPRWQVTGVRFDDVAPSPDLGGTLACGAPITPGV